VVAVSWLQNYNIDTDNIIAIYIIVFIVIKKFIILNDVFSMIKHYFLLSKSYNIILESKNQMEQPNHFDRLFYN
jgi:hypothetical protein